MHYGDLYDENEKWLLSPYPFADTFHIVDTKGAPIHPKGQRGIIPAGTSFLVYRVEFPDVAALAKRMFTTPRYNPWIYLKAPEGSGLPEGRQYFILLLPMDQDREADVEAAIAELLAAKGEATTWLAERAPTVRVAIEHKDVIVGMTLQEVVAAVGPPQRWFTGEGSIVPTVAWYPSRELWLERKVVKEIKPARPLPTLPSAAPPASTITSAEAAPAKAPASGEATTPAPARP
jgi:hypothetical protein